MAFWQSQAQACGSLSVYVDGRVSSGDPQAATTCFMRAYAHCHVATLVASFSYASGVVHTSSTYTFLIEPQLFAGGDHPCSIQLNAPSNSVIIALRPEDPCLQAGEEWPAPFLCAILPAYRRACGNLRLWSGLDNQESNEHVSRSQRLAFG
jgi:hypothetical protein